MNQVAPPDWRWQTHAHLPSTQDAALATAHANAPGWLAILAHAQTAGRGTRGRQWSAPHGNLNLSVLLRPNGPPLPPGYWALLAGVALHRALAAYTPGLMLKWPNDVLLDGAKLAGILIDSQIGPNQSADWVVIGFGANLAAAPPIEGRHTACLPPPAPPPEAVAHAVCEHIGALAAHDIDALREAWLALAHPIGTMLDIQTSQRRLSGSFAGLTARGELCLAGQSDSISSGEVFLRS